MVCECHEMDDVWEKEEKTIEDVRFITGKLKKYFVEKDRFFDDEDNLVYHYGCRDYKRNIFVKH